MNETTSSNRHGSSLAVKTYFTGVFCARRPVTVAVGSVLTAIGLCFVFMWLPQIGRVDLAHAFGAVCGLLFIVVFLGGGLFLLHKVVKNAKTVLSVTSDGISYGAKRYGWKDVTEIGVMHKYTNRKDLYCTTRLNSVVVELLVSRGLSSGEISKLFGALRDEVVTLHPHVCLSEQDHD